MVTPPTPPDDHDAERALTPAGGGILDPDLPAGVLHDEESDVDICDTPYLRELAQTHPARADAAKRWRKVVLRSLTMSPTITIACQVAQVTIKTVKTHQERDPIFAEACKAATEFSYGKLVHVAYQDAVHGHLEPVFHMGKEVGAVRKYSEQMRTLLLKGLIPETFDRAQQVNVSGAVGHVVVTPEFLADRAAAALASWSPLMMALPEPAADEQPGQLVAQ